MASEIGKALRAAVARRAGGLCEYCRIREEDASFRHQIDHTVSLKHGGDSKIDNLAYSCVLCIRFKGADVAAVGATRGKVIQLFHPRRDRWVDHFQFNDDRIEATTGEVTVRILRLNAPERVAERRLPRISPAQPPVVPVGGRRIFLNPHNFHKHLVI